MGAGAGRTRRLKLADAMPPTVRVSGCVPAGVPAVMLMTTAVLLPVVVVVVRFMPGTLFVLLSVIAEPLGIFTVVAANWVLPIVPDISAPVCWPTVTVGISSKFAVTITALAGIVKVVLDEPAFANATPGLAVVQFANLRPAGGVPA